MRWPRGDRIKQDWLADWLDLPHGIPSHDTFGRVFARIDPGQFEAGFLRWVQTVARTATPDVIAFDGKTIRRSRDTSSGHRPLQLVSAWATAQRLVLAQDAVDPKDNEITTLPHLLTNVTDTFGLATAPEATDRTVEKDHGRLEIRGCETISDPAVITWLDPAGRWPGLRTIVRVTATRQVGAQDPTTSVRSYVSSLPGDAKPLAEAVRSHGGIENSRPWVLDMAFREDESRARNGDSAQNLAVLRTLAVTLIQQDRTRKVGIKASRLRAAWDTGYLLQLLGTP